METLNRCIDGERKRDPTTDLRGIENSTRNTVSSLATASKLSASFGQAEQRNPAVAAATAATTGTRGAHAS